jgi:hypothetical protein
MYTSTTQYVFIAGCLVLPFNQLLGEEFSEFKSRNALALYQVVRFITALARGLNKLLRVFCNVFYNVLRSRIYSAEWRDD